MATTNPRRKLGANRAKHRQGRHLERQSRNHDPHPRIAHSLRISRGRQPPTRRLQHEAEEIAADEEDRDRSWRKPGQVRCAAGGDETC